MGFFWGKCLIAQHVSTCLRFLDLGLGMALHQNYGFPKGYRNGRWSCARLNFGGSDGVLEERLCSRPFFVKVVHGETPRPKNQDGLKMARTRVWTNKMASAGGSKMD